ncbi:membrane protein [Streptomyces noursei ATCC 11455]|nr:membrane protein [Streptomyces noursei ATCC 11455]ANZ21918.1 membrane protein [Streptomyces noursei ATCC 11455]
MNSRWLRNAATAAVTAGLMTAGTVVVATPATAANGSICGGFIEAVKDHGNIQGATMGRVTTSALNLRTRPYDWASSKGILYKKPSFWAYCSTGHWRWVKIEVLNGPLKGQYGWVDRWYTSLY